MRDDDIEWNQMYDLECWHCKRRDSGICKGKEVHNLHKPCVSQEEIKEVKEDGK